ITLHLNCNSRSGLSLKMYRNCAPIRWPTLLLDGRRSCADTILIAGMISSVSAVSGKPPSTSRGCTIWVSSFCRDMRMSR
ncbi:hypothetical protein LTR40_012668, partial [Exophiala xenobiotica]